jgi:hypothetical protein
MWNDVIANKQMNNLPPPFSSGKSTEKPLIKADPASEPSDKHWSPKSITKHEKEPRTHGICFATNVVHTFQKTEWAVLSASSFIAPTLLRALSVITTTPWRGLSP